MALLEQLIAVLAQITAGEISSGTSAGELRSYSVDDIVSLIATHAPGAGAGGDFEIASRANDATETLTLALANTFTNSDVGASDVTKTLPETSATLDGKVYGFRMASTGGGNLIIERGGTTNLIESGGAEVTSYTMSGQFDYVAFICNHDDGKWVIFTSSAAGGAVAALSSVPEETIVGRLAGTGTGPSVNLTPSQVFTLLGITAFAQTMLDDADAATVLSTLGITAFIQTLLDDADAATARGTLGVDPAGFVSGIATQTILGRETAGTGNNEELTPSQVFSILGVTAFAQTMLDDADAATVLSTLGITAFIQTLLDDADAATARGTLGVDPAGFVSGIATQTILGRETAGTGNNEELTPSQVFSILGVTAFAQTLLDDADAATARSTLGIAAAITSALAAGPTIVDAVMNGSISGALGTITGTAPSRTIDCGTGTYFEETVAGDITWILSNVPSGVYRKVLKLNYTSGVLTWTGYAGAIWKDNDVPTFTSGRTYYVTATTTDGNTSWELAYSEYYL